MSESLRADCGEGLEQISCRDSSRKTSTLREKLFPALLETLSDRGSLVCRTRSNGAVVTVHRDNTPFTVCDFGPIKAMHHDLWKIIT